jgi:hypothetical protein
MGSLFVALFTLLASSFRTRVALQAEILALRHQLAVFQKNAPPRLRLQRSDRLLWVLLSRCWSGWRHSLHIVRPDTCLASQSVRVVLDAEITAAAGKTERGGRHSQLDSGHESSEPVVGSAPHSRRIAQVGDRSSTIDGGQISTDLGSRLPRPGELS